MRERHWRYEEPWTVGPVPWSLVSAALFLGLLLGLLLGLMIAG